ncbi:MAG: hypothetical protein VX733_12190 [Candidatus Latescibacterota bacterium]|nr:hypothetical protein [Candidatus Latescibacterota bacterium]
MLERALIDAIDEAAPIFLDKYTRPGGTLVWQEEYPGDGVWADDLYEAFFNWPFHYALGGSDYIGAKSFVEWDAITRQLANDYGRVHREFVNDDDWFHNAENYVYFYALGLVDPTVRDNRDRACRFAGFYTGDDPEARCYDARHRIIRSPFSGSKGPLFHARWADVSYNLAYEHTTLGPEHELAADWQQREGPERVLHEIFDRVVMRSDVVVNLGVVPLVATAYSYTGDDRYRRWICDYVEAWIERSRANNGVIPDNVGPNGIVGEARGGQWWGGFYGWTGRFGHQMMGCAVTVAAEAAQLVTGDSSYLDLARMWLDTLVDRGRRDDLGRFVVPHKHNDEGWTEFAPMHPHMPVHLWGASMQERDRQRLEVLRDGSEAAWDTVTSRGPREMDDRPWVGFLAGRIPDYPEQILQANYQEVRRRLDIVLNDDQDLTKLDVHHWQQVNPVLTEALTHLTTGGPQAIYWGGLAVGRLRYFDVQRRRAGLPKDVAALVTDLGANSVSVSLVNLCVSETRDVIVAAGSFREHHLLGVSEVGGERIEVNASYLPVQLRPGTRIDLQLEVERYCRPPTYAFPWHGDSVLFR